MKVITFSSIKGGTGKSSCSIMTANYLGQCGKRILCIDLDIQNSLTFYYGENPDLLETNTIAEALHKGDLKGNIIPTGRKNIDFIPSSFNLVNLRAISPYSLMKLLHQISDQYDYCLIDTAPTWDNITLNALHAADQIITPVLLSQWDWKGAVFFRNQIMQDLGEHVLENWKLLFNGWKIPRTENPENLSNQHLALFKSDFDNILHIRIPETMMVKKHLDTDEKITMARDKKRLYIAIQFLCEALTGDLMDAGAF